MSLGHIDTHREPPARIPSSDEPRAPRFFCADSFWEAQGPARAFLASIQYCPRCWRAHERMHERIGSELFQDDDPLALIWAFAPEDRNPCTAQVIAASIVLFGRAREKA